MKNGHIKIEKGIPIAPHAKQDGISTALRAMKRGASIVINLFKRVGIPQRAKFIGIKVVTRKISDTEARVWRVK